MFALLPTLPPAHPDRKTTRASSRNGDRILYQLATGHYLSRALDALRVDPEAEASFDRAMAAFNSQTAVAVAAAYDFGSIGRVVA